MRGGAGDEDGGVQGLPLAAGAQDVEDGVGAGAVVGAGPAAAEAVCVGAMGDVLPQLLPQLVRDPPPVSPTRTAHHPALLSTCKPHSYYTRRRGYSDRP